MANPDRRNTNTESPEDMIFAENLKEFANRSGLIVGLEQGGKISPDEAYQRVKKLWKLLKKSHSSLIKDQLDELTDHDQDGADGDDDKS